MKGIIFACLIMILLLIPIETYAQCGDLNTDNSIDVSDMILLTNYIFNNGPAPANISGGDIDGCLGLDVSDVYYFVNYLFSGGPAPTCDSVICAPPTGGSISLESVSGLNGLGHLSIDSLISFNIRLISDGNTHGGITNGFRVYSPDSAEWSSTTGDTLVTGFQSMFDLVYTINSFSSDGLGADTIGFGGTKLFSGNLPSYYDEVSYSITIGPIPVTSTGKTICLDSSFYQPAGVWKWAGTDVIPNWDGPHCFVIEGLPSCCLGIRGNVDNDDIDEINISDLVTLVSYMFEGGNEPECLDEADIDASGGIDIADMVYLVNYMFQGGIDPASCI